MAKRKELFMNQFKAFDYSKTTIYYVYALMLNNEPVYIGMTKDLKIRIFSHIWEGVKNFDSWMVVFKDHRYNVAGGFEKGFITSLMLDETKEVYNKSMRLGDISNKFTVKETIEKSTKRNKTKQ